MKPSTGLRLIFSAIFALWSPPGWRWARPPEFAQRDTRYLVFLAANIQRR